MKYCLFFLVFFLSSISFGALDETLIQTEDKQCGLHYLTTLNHQNWTIKLKEGNCENGFVHGYAEVQILPPTKKLSETISGFFMDGYWMGTFMGKGHVLSRTNPEENQQALSYIFQEQDNITYILQLRSVSLEQRAYGPFTACPDLRVLAVLKDRTLFHQKDIQEKIFHHVLKEMAPLCDELDNIAVFGSDKLNPESNEIVFHMQINPMEETYQVLTLPPDKGQKLQVLSEKDFTQPEDKLKTIPLAHLDLLSRIQDKSKKGRIVIHVNQLNLDGTAMANLPQPVLLKNYPNLQQGWMVVEGDYFNHQMSVSHIQVCQKEWCSDVS